MAKKTRKHGEKKRALKIGYFMKNPFSLTTLTTKQVKPAPELFFDGCQSFQTLTTFSENLKPLTKQSKNTMLTLSVSQRERSAVITPVSSDLLCKAKFAGCRLIKYLLAGNRPDCLNAVVSTRLLLFRQKSHITKRSGA